MALVGLGLGLGAGEISGVTGRGCIGIEIGVVGRGGEGGVGVCACEVVLLEEHVGDDARVGAGAGADVLMRRFVEVVADEDEAGDIRQDRYNQSGVTDR